MSAYGTFTATSTSVDLLPSTIWDLPQPVRDKPASPFRRLAMHHLRLDRARTLPDLLEYTHRVFAAEIEEGRTYPQETDGLGRGSGSDSRGGDGMLSSGVEDASTADREVYTRAAYEAYFWAGDVIVAIGTEDDAAHGEGTGRGGNVEASRGGRSWEEALVGFYYVKPNYPGRSSHPTGIRATVSPLPTPPVTHAMGVLRTQREGAICNAGFLVPPPHRQFGYGMVLGKSYLHYAPLLGYKASVFNLVYASNTGSLRIWDSLGFTRAGLIPRAGRLRRADGSGEEWVDSIIYYRSFVDEKEWTRPIE
ncbi:hypothetical protein F5148DRAFT_1148949 [Russula earlei]|uniref:Uncharacterized protein n=1 Tax=Russula earlei TaxID=71964 RepID=A0ACC0UAP2_9AGAM|nr:hypothetical protein F5148DRAFT_1148949 [Russula earlei]